MTLQEIARLGQEALFLNPEQSSLDVCDKKGANELRKPNRSGRNLRRQIKIRRQAKIRKDANPFDPRCKSYFLERASQQKFGISRHQAGVKTS